MRKQRAFTLIELIMVIVIIGILAAIAIPRFIDLRKEANMAACKGGGSALRAAIANFYASAALNEACDGTRATTKCWPKKPIETTLLSYVQQWPKSPDYYHPGKGPWNDYYDEDSGVLNVEQACTW